MISYPKFLTKNTKKDFKYFNFKNNILSTELNEKNKQEFSKPLDEILCLIEDTVEEILNDFSESTEKELILSNTLYNLILKYIIISYYRSLYHKSLYEEKIISVGTYENDLNIIANTEDLKENLKVGNPSDLLKMLINQTTMGYLCFWSAPQNMEFILTDNTINYSKDVFSGGKLAHIQETKEKNIDLNNIENSLDYFPNNYLILPINAKLSIVLCSPFMSLYTEENKDYRPVFSILNLTGSTLKDKRFNKPLKETIENTELQIFEKQELNILEMHYNNEILLDNANKFIVYSTFNNVKSSLSYYENKFTKKNNIVLKKDISESNMSFESAKLVKEGHYLNYYVLKYKNKFNKDKYYEMISHDKNIKTIKDLYTKKPQAVVLFVFDKNHEKILLNKEFRMAIGQYVYGSVAGLIEDGESFEEAAKRELKEETGLDLIKVIDVLSPSYTATGISNEKSICVFCEAEGQIDVTNEEADEDITPLWFTKEQLKELFDNKNTVSIAARTQMFCYMWMNGGII